MFVKYVCIPLFLVTHTHIHTRKKPQGAHIGAFGENNTLCIIARSKRPQWRGQFYSKKT